MITGCSPGGIGHALAIQFQSKGLHVFATDRNIKVLAEFRTLGIEVLQLEVTSPESVAEVKRHISERTNGSLDYRSTMLDAITLFQLWMSNLPRSKPHLTPMSSQ